MKCKFCQAPIPSNSPSCFHCGRQQNDPLAPPPGPLLAAVERPRGSSGGVMMLIIAGLVALAGVAAFMVVVSRAPASAPPSPVAREADPEAPIAVAPAPPPWTGEAPLRCDTGEHKLSNKTLDFQAMALRIEGTCQVTLEDCTVRVAGDAIRVMGQGRLLMKGGSIDSQRTALRADDEAQATFDGTTIHGEIDVRQKSLVRIARGTLRGTAMHGRGDPQAIRVDDEAAVTLLETTIAEGQVSRYGGGVVIELKEGEDAEARIRDERALAQKMSRYQSGACDGVVECFTQNDVTATADVHLSMPIGDDGKARGARVVKAGGATPVVHACLTKLATETHIENFEGPKGTLECKVSGMISGGTRMISVSTNFVPDKAAAPAR